MFGGFAAAALSPGIGLLITVGAWWSTMAIWNRYYIGGLKARQARRNRARFVAERERALLPPTRDD